MQHDNEFNAYRQTTWFNPLDVPQSFVVFDGGPRGQKITIAPKASITLPGHLDHAIQHIQNGVVMGGLAPQLVNKSAASPPALHEALDTGLQKRLIDEAKAAHAESLRQLANEAAIVAAAKLIPTQNRK